MNLSGKTVLLKTVGLVAALLQVAPHAEVMLIGAEDPGALIHAPKAALSGA